MRKLLFAIAGVLLLVAGSAPAQVLGQGTVSFFELFNGPASLTTQRVTLAPGTGNQWHVHPGPVFLVLVSGTLTEETGCGETVVYHPGDAFTESYPPDRVHRIFNYGTDPAVFVSTIIKPVGSVSTNFAGPLCGPPRDISECMDDGWMRFQYPRAYENQGDCVSWVKTNK